MNNAGTGVEPDRPLASAGSKNGFPSPQDTSAGRRFCAAFSVIPSSSAPGLSTALAAFSPKVAGPSFSRTSRSSPDFAGDGAPPPVAVKRAGGIADKLTSHSQATPASAMPPRAITSARPSRNREEENSCM